MSKFKAVDKRTFIQKTKDFLKSLLFWRGRSKGMIYTRNIELDDIRYIFFPKGFEKYGYLGTQIWNEKSSYFKALYPLVLALDYEAKPKWCPRWFLRFLHVFGSDKSIVRVRNWTLHNLLRKLTNGIAFVDWKTKWHSYDLRISIHGPKHLQNLADKVGVKIVAIGIGDTEVPKVFKNGENVSNVADLASTSFNKLLKELR